MLAFKLSAEAVDSVTKPVAPTIKNVAIFLFLLFFVITTTRLPMVNKPNTVIIDCD